MPDLGSGDRVSYERAAELDSFAGTVSANRVGARA